MTTDPRYPVPGPTPLTSNEVLKIVLNRTTDKPLSTVDIVDMCQAAHPSYPNVCTYQVAKRLRYLERRRRVVSLHGNTDRDRLARLGVAHTHPQYRYWTTAAALDIADGPFAEEAVYDDLPLAHDGREPFAVSHDRMDAPDGAVLELTDSGYPGWWWRCGDQWAPVDPPPNRKGT